MLTPRIAAIENPSSYPKSGQALKRNERNSSVAALLRLMLGLFNLLHYKLNKVFAVGCCVIPIALSRNRSFQCHRCKKNTLPVRSLQQQSDVDCRSTHRTINPVFKLLMRAYAHTQQTQGRAYVDYSHTCILSFAIRKLYLDM